MSEVGPDIPGSPARADEPDWPEMQGPDFGTAERGRRWLRVVGVAGGVIVVALGAVWLTRERIADNIISNELAKRGIPARYRIDSIGPRRQVLSQVVIGDPAHPDLTIERVEVEIEPRLGYPAIGRVRLLRPRLFGTVHDGKASFGSLDKVLFQGPSNQPFRLPEMNLAIEDGRARLVTDQGQVGVKLDGRGPLRNGFMGTLAAVAPRLAMGDCAAQGVSLFGHIAVAGERPQFAGPARMSALDCKASALHLRQAQVDVDGTAQPALDGGRATLGLASGAFAMGSTGATGLNGTVDATWGKGGVTARYDLLGRGLSSPQVRLATLAAKGTLRTRGGIEAEGSFDGGGMRLGEGLAATLEGYEQSTRGSLFAPLLRQLRESLQREGRASRLAGDFLVRQGADGTRVVIPQGRLVGGSGATLLALSRLQYAGGSADGRTAPRLAGDFTTGGAGLPRIAGRMERTEDGDTLVRMTMAEYRAGDARMAFPQLTIAQTRNGALGFSGVALASGPLPGGRAERLEIPFDGNRTPAGAITVGRRCMTVRFAALAYSDLALDQHALLLCPGSGGAMVRSDGRGLRIAVGTPGLDLTGRLGETPIHLASGPVGYAQPGVLYGKALDVALGPADTATRFHLADLRAQVGKEIAGTFAGTDVKLASVPLDLLDAAGTWRYAGGRLDLSGATFRLEDRAEVDRFQPLRGAGGQLSLEANKIAAAAVLHEPSTGRDVLRVNVDHDLSRGVGRADLVVDKLVFDKTLQPDMLSRQLLGVVANAQGAIAGRGQVEWNGGTVRSSGRFGTEGLDFAAAFGPVKGAAGTIEFTDLVNFVTAPHQSLRIASINPGIEVTDGRVLFAIKPGAVLAIEDGTWPFLGGTLHLRPVDLKLGVPQTRRYELEMTGVDAAKFVQQLDLANMTATGTFDGTLPLVFDENGGRIEGGLLTSRPPGGNVSYVGALTYKNLSPIANFAFDALKSLDYRQMRIAMDGSLAGEIVTRVRFDGVKQGPGAKRNFLTQRLAKLPLQFNVNVRAPFYQLIGSFKSMYDPAYVADPRTLGLIDAKGHPIAPHTVAPTPADKGIQPPDSEKKP